ncbi:MAG: DMT family transporter [Thermoflexales bacterium]|nr:DMT family transporter [Thermoflexales bacterium]
MPASNNHSRDRQSQIPARVWADVALLLVAVVWGTAFVGQRVAMEHVGAFAFGATRFALGGLCLLPLIAFQYTIKKRAMDAAPISRGLPSTLRGGFVLGLLLFGGASLQQIGLVHTTAGKGGFITGLYIVIVPLLLALAWRQLVKWTCWLGVGLAVAGLFLLSMQAQARGGEFQLAPGDGWVLAGAFMWALHVIAVGKLVPGHEPLQLALVQYIVCALLSALAALAVEGNTWGGVLIAWQAVLYTGIGSIGLGYTTQVVAQRYTPPAHTALILSLESVFAALAGWLLLGEMMTPRMIAGAGLMLVGIIVAQLADGQQAEIDPKGLQDL